MIELSKRSVLVEYVLFLYFSAEALLSIYTSLHACLYSTVSSGSRVQGTCLISMLANFISQYFLKIGCVYSSVFGSFMKGIVTVSPIPLSLTFLEFSYLQQSQEVKDASTFTM